MGDYTKEELNRLLTRAQVEAEFGIKKRWLEAAAPRGVGPPIVRIGRKVFYRRRDILEFIEGRM